ncbi:MBL fold metallo-hydrolase [Marinobacter caseinilyticus]|uniref:MBL fold metallo-hydrolase n=1 Tax=Marinobacter caseinilyticus TaxID=2692195 RepID=UPI0014083023|nr:MBL fold metallo-hydrolase [Marinobacter caseinilyticus]
MSIDPIVIAFFDKDTNTYSYVVRDPESKSCAVIDSVLNYDAASGKTGTELADTLIDYIRQEALTVEWILETHVHADHLSAAPYLHSRLGGKTGIGANIRIVQETFGKVFNVGSEFARDGRQFDRLFTDGSMLNIGHLICRVMHTPGHTPACLTYLIGDAAFVGDTLFMPDYGTARCDFPGGDARALYRSIQKLMALPPTTRVFLCHDYGTPDREHFQYETTIADQRQFNVHIHQGVSEEEFVRMRTERDATLKMPNLLLPSVQVNMRAGHLPPPEDNGQRYLKIPLNLF